MQFNIKDAVCQSCGEKIGDGKGAVNCALCDTPHHEDCWHDFGCSTFGCPNNKGPVEEEQPSTYQQIPEASHLSCAERDFCKGIEQQMDQLTDIVNAHCMPGINAAISLEMHREEQEKIKATAAAEGRGMPLTKADLERIEKRKNKKEQKALTAMWGEPHESPSFLKNLIRGCLTPMIYEPSHDKLDNTLRYRIVVATLETILAVWLLNPVPALAFATLTTYRNVRGLFMYMDRRGRPCLDHVKATYIAGPIFIDIIVTIYHILNKPTWWLLSGFVSPIVHEPNNAKTHLLARWIAAGVEFGCIFLWGSLTWIFIFATVITIRIRLALDTDHEDYRAKAIRMGPTSIDLLVLGAYYSIFNPLRKRKEEKDLAKELAPPPNHSSCNIY